MKILFSIVAALVVGTAHADTWVYHATLPDQVVMHVDMSSVKTVTVYPEIRSAAISLGRSGQEASISTVEVACKYRGIRTSTQDLFSVTQPDKTFGLLVARICSK
jgi:hypothetical protein